MKHLGERLTAFVDGELSHGERDRVLAHLAMCANCRAEADILRGLKRRLNDLADGVPASELLGRLRALGEPGDPMPPRVRPLPGMARARRPGPRLFGSATARTSAWLTTGPRAAPLPRLTGGSSAPPLETTAGASPSGASTQPMKRPVRGPRGRRSGDTRPGDTRPAGRAAAEEAPSRRRRRRYVVAGAVSLAVLGIGTASFAAGADSSPLPRVTPAIERFAVEHALISGDVPLTDPVPSQAPGRP